MSYFKAAGLMLLIHIAFAGVGWWIAGREGALAATVVALAFHILVFWYAEKIVLKLHNAREVRSDDASPMIRDFLADLTEALAGAHQYEAALEACLALVERDRKGVGDAAREVMIDIFRVLPSDSELTTTYRRKLSTALY